MAEVRDNTDMGAKGVDDLIKSSETQRQSNFVSVATSLNSGVVVAKSFNNTIAGAKQSFAERAGVGTTDGWVKAARAANDVADSAQNKSVVQAKGSVTSTVSKAASTTGQAEEAAFFGTNDSDAGEDAYTRLKNRGYNALARTFNQGREAAVATRAGASAYVDAHASGASVTTSVYEGAKTAKSTRLQNTKISKWAQRWRTRLYERPKRALVVIRQGPSAILKALGRVVSSGAKTFLAPAAAALFGLIVLIVVIGGEGALNEEAQAANAVFDSLPPWVSMDFLMCALEIQDETGIYASVTIAQAQLEVGGTWDGHALYPTAEKYHNYFGVRASGGRCEYKGMVTWDGQSTNDNGMWRGYDSIEQGLWDRARLLLTSPAYSEVEATAYKRGSSLEQLEALSASPWCEGGYSTLSGIMDSYNLWYLDHLTLDTLFSSDTMLQWALGIAADDSHGYSMASRSGNPDYDCSSFVYSAAQAAGYPVSYLGSTETMINDFTSWGWKMKLYTGVKDLMPGDVLLRRNGELGSAIGHTEIYVGDGQTVGAHGDLDGMPGDSSGNEISVVGMSTNWMYVLTRG